MKERYPKREKKKIILKGLKVLYCTLYRLYHFRSIKFMFQLYIQMQTVHAISYTFLYLLQFMPIIFQKNIVQQEIIFFFKIRFYFRYSKVFYPYSCLFCPRGRKLKKVCRKKKVPTKLSYKLNLTLFKENPYIFLILYTLTQK